MRPWEVSDKTVSTSPLDRLLGYLTICPWLLVVRDAGGSLSFTTSKGDYIQQELVEVGLAIRSPGPMSERYSSLALYSSSASAQAWAWDLI